MSHQVFLPIDHPYRKKIKSFNGKAETRVARNPLSGRAVYERVKNLNVDLGKTSKSAEKNLWKKGSIFWDLPYWEHLSIRHCLDVLDVEKNICESIVGTLLNIQGKTKDDIKARKDMVEMGIRDKLAPQESGKRTYLPPACYTMSKKEKTSFCGCLNDVKVPSGYSSNIKELVSMKDLKLVVVDVDVLDYLQVDVVVTLSQLEMYFPPSFFDIMVHLIIHLVREIKMSGPVFLRYMYPFERYMGVLKGYVRNQFRPECSIIEGYAAEEVIEFCTDYLANFESIGVLKSIHEGKLTGKGTIGYKAVLLSVEMRDKAHRLVLQHKSEVHPYLDEHMSMLRHGNPSKSEGWVTIEHNRTFMRWFKDRVMGELSEVPNNISETIKWLAYGPAMLVSCYEGYDINRYTFYTKRQDDKSTMQNSGVTLVALSRDYSSATDTMPVDSALPYYGVIEEIWELDYKIFKIPLFRCSWVDNRRGVQIDELGFTLVDFGELGYHDMPVILASQAKQVFYISDPVNSKWSIVLQGKRSIVGIGDVVDEEEYDHFDETPPFSIGIQALGEDNIETSYMRCDHGEGLWVDNHT